MMVPGALASENATIATPVDSRLAGCGRCEPHPPAFEEGHDYEWTVRYKTSGSYQIYADISNNAFSQVGLISSGGNDQFVVGNHTVTEAPPSSGLDPLVPAPSGYTEVFKSDFSNTTMQATTDGGNQWWYHFSGGEYGYDWEDTNLFAGQSSPIRIQTLVGSPLTLTDYVYSELVNVGGDRRSARVHRCSCPPARPE